MAKIAAKTIAAGAGWSVEDVLCSAGPADRPFQEQHSRVNIAIVVSGTFQYRSAGGRHLMTPGSLFLGNMGQTFECSHDHGSGDRCISFGYDAGHFETLAAAIGGRPTFRHMRIPPLRSLSPVVSAARAGLAGSSALFWEELSLRVAAQALRLSSELPTHRRDVRSADVARVVRSIDLIERQAAEGLSLVALARETGLSTWHFLRTFERVVGTTPHQYGLRARLRSAADAILEGHSKVIDVALDSGFGDVSNFNRAFRNEFGMSPGVYRQRAQAI